MPRWSGSYVVVAAIASFGAGCVTSGHRNVVPNEPGVRTARFGGGVTTATDGTRSGGILFTGGIGLPGAAEAGFDSGLAYLTKSIVNGPGFAAASSFEFGWFGGMMLGYSSIDGFVGDFQLAPRLGHQFLFEWGVENPWRLALGTGVQTRGDIDLDAGILESSPVFGTLTAEFGKRYLGSNDDVLVSLRVRHVEPMSTTGDDQATVRYTTFGVAISFQ